MRTKLLVAAVISAGLAVGVAQEQQAEEKILEMPAHVLAFENLGMEQKKAYWELKVKIQQFATQKRIFECLEKIHEAKKIFDQDPGVWNIQGSCYVEIRAFNKAASAFRQALAIDPNNIGVMFNLAEIDFVTKQWEGAVAKFLDFIEALEESNSEMEGNVLELHRLAKFKVMLSQLKLGEIDEAKELAKAYEEFDDTPFRFYSKAALAYFSEDEELANEWLGTAFRVYQNPELLANWQDTLIEYGYIKSFYGGEAPGEIELEESE
ncbi:MAG: tetratricopeptide repeat protein [Verrucomicrobiota bacterium]